MRESKKKRQGDTQTDESWASPETVYAEYQNGAEYKGKLGTRGLYEQNRINERFYAGDQWHGASAGNDRPLVRYNVIKRIGDYKLAVMGASPVTVNYSAEGVPNTLELQKAVTRLRDNAAARASDMHRLSDVLGEDAGEIPADEEINLVMSAMSDYFRVTAERLQFDAKKEEVLRNSYIAGTGVLYTYWDETVKTGLYADEGRRQPVTGDIACEVLDIENVYFGNPNEADVEAQPYIIVAQRLPVDVVRREARRNGRPEEEIETIGADKQTAYLAGELGGDGSELQGAENVTVLTKFYKEWNDAGDGYVIKAVKVTEKATVREAWDIGVTRYPFAVFRWERRHENAYGESEVTYLIPNQIAINRMITASVWAVMMMGMPIMVVDQDVIDMTVTPITNDPGQILIANGGGTDVRSAVGFINPPQFSPRFSENVEQMIAQTLTQSGANDAALGDVRPDNTSAIIAVREAATMPMQMMQNRFYTFVEDVARIWAEFWVRVYGKRSLKVEDNSGTWYLPFDGERYKDVLISTKIDVGASSLWSEAQSIATLDNLFDRKVIDVVQYLNRLPKGTVPNLSGLIRELQEANAAAGAAQAAQIPGGAETVAANGSDTMTEQDILQGLPAEALQKLQQMPSNVKSKIVNAGMKAARNAPEQTPIGRIL